MTKKERRKEYQRKYRQKNRKKLSEEHKKYYQKNKETLTKKANNRYTEYRGRSRELKLIKKFGITDKQYEELWLKQNGVCAICLKPESIKHQAGTLRKLAVDHDHKTGIIRGLLCSRCNNGIGLLGDSVEMLKRAVKYLI